MAHVEPGDAQEEDRDQKRRQTGPTPGPWIVDEGRRDFRVASEEDDSPEGLIATTPSNRDRDRANARRIVTAVNAHDDLLAACAAAKQALRATSQAAKDYSYELGLLNAALARAKGGA